MEGKVTEKQLKTLELIYGSIYSNGYAPTMAEIKATLGFSSNQTVINYLGRLEKEGYIKREDGQARSIKILPLGFKAINKEQVIPILGTTSAGPFIEDVQTFASWMEPMAAVGQGLDHEKIFESKDKVYVVRVQGDSMINAGILDGDLLLLKECREYRNGDIVLARTSDGTTVKRFVAENKKVYLKPENPKYKNIPFFHDMFLDGKVITNLSALKRLV